MMRSVSGMTFSGVRMALAHTAGWVMRANWSNPPFAERMVHDAPFFQDLAVGHTDQVKDGRCSVYEPATPHRAESSPTP